MIDPTTSKKEQEYIATNIRRLMIANQFTYEQLCTATGIDERTLRGVMRLRNKPHQRTLERLATALGVSADDLCKPVLCQRAEFDRATNTMVETTIKEYIRDFHGWEQADYDELYSRFGVGGPLTPEGVLAVARKMNADRETVRKVRVILESSEGEFLALILDNLYRRATRQQPADVKAEG